jgi:hypothetical protein
MKAIIATVGAKWAGAGIELAIATNQPHRVQAWVDKLCVGHAALRPSADR